MSSTGLHNSLQPRLFLFSRTKQLLGPRQTNYLNCTPPFHDPQSVVLLRQTRTSQKSNAISPHHHDMLLGLINTSGKRADLSVLLITGCAFLLLYWVANFVVPGFIEKDFQTDQENDATTTNDETTNFGSQNGKTLGRSLATKRGFGETKK